MTARLFCVGLARKRLTAGSRPLTCQRAKDAMCATHRLFGALRILKDLSLSLLAHLVDVGAFRNVPNSPKDANFCVCIFWRSWALRGV
jgi:hypothetical protein